MPMSSNLKFGARIALGAGLILLFSRSAWRIHIDTYFLAEPLIFIKESPALIKFTSDLSNSIP
jgi:hypothetical protein